MSDIDEFAVSLLEEAKRFLEKASEAPEGAAQDSYLHAALMLGFCSLEAHVNSIADDFSARPELSPQDRSVLLEREIRLDDGEFILKGLKIYRLEDRILFLHRRFSAKPLDKTSPWWLDLSAATDLRNQLTHPKKVPAIKKENVMRALRAIIGTINALFEAIYRRKFPALNRDLHSSLAF